MFDFTSVTYKLQKNKNKVCFTVIFLLLISASLCFPRRYISVYHAINSYKVRSFDHKTLEPIDIIKNVNGRALVEILPGNRIFGYRLHKFRHPYRGYFVEEETSISGTLFDSFLACFVISFVVNSYFNNRKKTIHVVKKFKLMFLAFVSPVIFFFYRPYWSGGYFRNSDGAGLSSTFEGLSFIWNVESKWFNSEPSIFQEDTVATMSDSLGFYFIMCFGVLLLAAYFGDYKMKNADPNNSV